MGGPLDGNSTDQDLRYQMAVRHWSKRRVGWTITAWLLAGAAVILWRLRSIASISYARGRDGEGQLVGVTLGVSDLLLLAAVLVLPGILVLLWRGSRHRQS
jgi:hypothetical protein